MEFADAAEELYGVLPAEFTATRKRLAAELSREEGRRLTALRRPTVPAWAVNQLVRDDAVGPLLDLGERMRAAWSDGGDLAPLERERNTLVADLVRRARELADAAGRPLSDAFADEVEETLRAAIADPSAAEAVRAGRLDHPLRHAGFGPFGAAPPSPRPSARTRGRSAPEGMTAPRKKNAAGAKERREPEERERQRREARRVEEIRAAERRVQEAERSLAEWTSTLEEARQRLSEADDELTGLRDRLHEAESRRKDLDRRVQLAEREHTRAERAAKEARREARRLSGDHA